MSDTVYTGEKMKNRLCILLILVATFGLIGASASVDIPDANLRAAIAEALGKGSRALITESEMQTFYVFDLTGRGIRDLTGLETAENLQMLTLTNNLITDLMPISELIDLRDLYVGDNVIFDLSPLTNLVNLVELWFWDNSVSDLTSLGKLPRLQIIWFDGNAVQDVSPLSTCQHLWYISSWGNPILDVSPLAELPKLRELNISGCELSDITPLANCIGLQWLRLEWNNIEDVSPLKGLRRLRWVSLVGNPIADISDLRISLPQTTIILDEFAGDVNEDGSVDIVDLIHIAAEIGKENQQLWKHDVNADGIVDILDIIAVSEEMDALKGQSAAPVVIAADRRQLLETCLAAARAEDDGSIVFQEGIARLQRLLVSLIREKTTLLANYPNPFNPETWIPYQLAEAGEVKIVIYDMRGIVIRRLSIGHQPVGMYQSKSRAAYWDGRNAVGEPVASGIYFYTITASEFTATRKMLIRK